MNAMRYIPEAEFLAKVWQQEEDRYQRDIEDYRNRVDRWLIAAILVVPALLLFI